MSVFARWQRTIVDDAGNVVPGASVEVRNAETNAMAVLYSDRGGTIGISNPVTADAEGFAGFFVANGTYRITATSGAFSRVWDYVGITSILEIDGAAAGRVDQVTWAGLNAIDGAREGQPAIVYGPDAGTHADPVVSGTVANTGRFIWSVSPEGWRRVAGLESNLVHAINSGDGSLNDVQASTASTYNTAAYGALFTVNFTAQNTGAMTLSVNGDTPRPFVANDGSAIPAGYVDNDMSAQFQIDDDGNYRLANIRGPAGSSNVVGTSASSVEIGTGSKSFTIVESDRGWGLGARLRVTSDANGANSMTGIVTAYSGPTLTILVSVTGGSGTYDDWTINIAGEPGTGDLLSTNNLSDLESASDARLNLEIGQFADRAALAAATIPAAVKNVKLLAYDATVDPSLGGQNMREATLSEYNATPSLLRSTSNGGAKYWIINEPIITYAMAGAVPNDDTDDATAAFNSVKSAGVPIYLDGKYYFASNLSVTNLPIEIFAHSVEKGQMIFKNATTGGNAALSITQANPRDYLSLKNFAIITMAESAGQGLAVNADLQAYERVGPWGEISGVYVGGENDLLASPERWESENGFDGGGIVVDQAHNYKISGNLVVGRRDKSLSGRSQFTQSEYGIRLTCPANATSAPYLHPTDVTFRDNKVFWAKKGIAVEGDIEGFFGLDNVIVGVDYGYWLVCEYNRVWFHISGGHTNAFVGNIYVKGIDQGFIHDHLFYKRPDATDDSTFVHLVGCDRVKATNNIMVNNTATELAGGACTGFTIEDCNDVDISGTNITRFTTFVAVADAPAADAWVTATAYVYGDYVTSGGFTYICIVNHTSGVFADDLAAAKWQLAVSLRCNISDNSIAAPFDISTSKIVDDTTINKDVRISNSSLYGKRTEIDRNSEVVTVNVGSTTIVAKNLSYANHMVGQKFKVSGRVAVTRPASAGITTIKIVKSAGTATVEFDGGLSQLSAAQNHAASGTETFAIEGILEVTVGGTLSIALQAATTGGSGSVAIDDGVLRVEAI